jgi:leucine dehydrogenase
MLMDEQTNLDENNLNNPDKLFELAEKLGFGELHIKFDQETGLKAIIAIHSTKLGTALGGVRCKPYDFVCVCFF